MPVPLIAYKNVMDLDQYLLALFNNIITPENIHIDVLGLFTDFYDTIALEYKNDKSKTNVKNPIKCKREYLYIKVFVTLTPEIKKRFVFNTDTMTLAATKYLSRYVRFNDKIYLFVNDIRNALSGLRQPILDLLPVNKTSEFFLIPTEKKEVYQAVLTLWFKQVYPIVDTSKIDFKKEEDVWQTLNITNSSLVKYKKVKNDFAVLDTTYEKLVETVYLNVHPNLLDDTVLVLYNNKETDVEGRFVRTPEHMRKNKIGLLLEHQDWSTEHSAILLSDLSGLKIETSLSEKPMLAQNNYHVVIASRYVYNTDITPGYNNIPNKLSFAGTPTKTNDKNTFDPYLHMLGKDELDKRLANITNNIDGKTLDRFFGINATHYGNLTTEVAYPYLIKDFDVPDMYNVTDVYNKPIAEFYPTFTVMLFSFLSPVPNLKTFALTNKKQDYAFSNMNINGNTPNNLYMANLYFYTYGEKIEKNIDEPMSIDKAFASKDPKKIEDMLTQLQNSLNNTFDNLLANKPPVNNPNTYSALNTYALISTYKDLLLQKNRLNTGLSLDLKSLVKLASMFDMNVNYLLALLNAQNYKQLIHTIMRQILMQYNMLHLLPQILKNIANKDYLLFILQNQLPIPYEVKVLLMELFKLK